MLLNELFEDYREISFPSDNTQRSTSNNEIDTVLTRPKTGHRVLVGAEEAWNKAINHLIDAIELIESHCEPIDQSQKDHVSALVDRLLASDCMNTTEDDSL